MKNNLKFIIQITGSAICFWLLFRIVSPELLINILRQSDVSLIIFIAAIMVPAIFARSLRWYLILTRRGVPVSLGSITNVTFIGMALNLFLPASAGDVVRSYYGWQRHGHKEEMLATALTDKVVALFSLTLLGAIGGFICGNRNLAVLAAVLTVPTGLILLFPVRWVWKILSVLASRVLNKRLDSELLLRSFHMSWSTFLWAMFISILGWMITNLMYFLAILAVGARIEIGFAFAMAPLINIIRMLPVSISGLGSADALMIQLLEGVGISSPLTLAASMIINLNLIILPGIIGTFLMLKNIQYLRKSDQNIS